MPFDLIFLQCDLLERTRGRARGKQWRNKGNTIEGSANNEQQVITDYGVEEWRDSGNSANIRVEKIECVV